MAKTDKKNSAFSYDSAMLEIQNLVENIQNDKIGIDNLEEHVERVTQLIKMCQEKLRNLEQTVEAHIKE
jgi:exodeoxyribonuclease VII small subunit